MEAFTFCMIDVEFIPSTPQRRTQDDQAPTVPRLLRQVRSRMAFTRQARRNRESLADLRP